MSNTDTHTKNFATIDGNEAAARGAYPLSEVVAIYPITPSSPMGEWSDAWAAAGQANLWGTIPSVVEMQSEGGAAGAVHGALQAGSLTTTFTASQGLMLMLPNLYKIAGELTSAVIHVAARSLAAQALSIFGDHSDVMAARMTGCALLCSNSVQEAHDFATIATRASLASRIPFLHFFDGFRTSHEVQKIELISADAQRSLIKDEWILAHRSRALTPDHPVLRGTAQNPDVYFQARETVNPFYFTCADALQDAMDEFAAVTGRQYQPYEYHGASDAERLVVLMGSGCETAHETVDSLVSQGEKVGVLKVRMYRPFDNYRFIAAIPKTVKAIAVLDRTKEPGSSGEPLYLDVVNAVYELGQSHWAPAAPPVTLPVEDKPELNDLPLNLEHKIIHVPTVVGGRYGLSSKEFTPAMVKGVLDNLLKREPQNHFTVGIIDDVTHTSLDYDPRFSTEPESVVRAVFYGLGSDGTVGANKNSIKIIGGETDNYAQGYFVYDSKKSGSVTVSHLRFGPDPIRSTYLITEANFTACHQWEFVTQFNLLDAAVPGSTFLLNSPYEPEETWVRLPMGLQQQIVDKQLKVYCINASQVAKNAGMGSRINTVMQTCFFALAGVLPREEAIEQIKKAIRKTYGKKGEDIVRMNIEAVESTLAHLYEVPIGAVQTEAEVTEANTWANAPAFVRDVLGEITARRGDALPVSALPCDGTFPTGTTKYEKRNVGAEIPVWDPDVCVQCGKCIMVCPHAVIRGKVYEPGLLGDAPDSFKSTEARDRDWKATGQKFTIQVAAEDCTGCALCVDICPAKNKSEPRKRAINMAPQLPLREQERSNWDFFLSLPNPDRNQLDLRKVAHQQMQEPLFEFSGACSGCGETPYVKLASQLFGDRMIVANATGCSSIYGGNLPTTPWTVNAEGRGPAWSNSLFEDNAEFGFGFRLSIDQHTQFAQELLSALAETPIANATVVPRDLATAILNADQSTEADINEQRERVTHLKQYLHQALDNASDTLKSQLNNLLSVADYLVKKSVWIMGGDGWAYDIGYGGLDHVLASGRNVNILVMDTEVYSNTGGQMSKATPKGAIAKFAAGGKPAGKKDLGLMAMTYGNVYVGSVSMGARDEHTLRVFMEAESYDGPSLILAYSHCIAHGIDMAQGMAQQKLNVETGRWFLYRYDPRRAAEGHNPLQMDSRAPKGHLSDSMYRENRFAMLTRSKPEEARKLLEEAELDVRSRWALYHYMANQPWGGSNGNGAEAKAEEAAKS
ncbi:MAG: pyruvate:ferredoxin (flavodoxin) oxidoreductase [Prochlorotrichaceae cyanobacterium]